MSSPSWQYTSSPLLSDAYRDRQRNYLDKYTSNLETGFRRASNKMGPLVTFLQDQRNRFSLLREPMTLDTTSTTDTVSSYSSTSSMLKYFTQHKQANNSRALNVSSREYNQPHLRQPSSSAQQVDVAMPSAIKEDVFMDSHFQEKFNFFVNDRIDRLAKAGLIRPSRHSELSSAEQSEDFESLMTRLAESLDEVENMAKETTLRQSDTQTEQSSAEENTGPDELRHERGFPVSVEHGKQYSTALKSHALHMTEKVETALMNCETRLLDAKQQCEVELKTEMQRRKDDHNMMIEQCKNWEQKLSSSVNLLQVYKANLIEMKHKSLALRTSSQERVDELKRLLQSSSIQ